MSQSEKEIRADNRRAVKINAYVFALPYLFWTKSRNIKVAPTKRVPIGMMNGPNTNGANLAVTTFAITMDNKYNKILNLPLPSS